jgi:hypothetical protein
VYNTLLPSPLPTINELKAKLNEERASTYKTAITEWDARRLEGDDLDPNTKPKAPLLVTFKDVKAEHTALL